MGDATGDDFLRTSGFGLRRRRRPRARASRVSRTTIASSTTRNVIRSFVRSFVRSFGLGLCARYLARRPAAFRVEVGRSVDDARWRRDGGLETNRTSNERRASNRPDATSRATRRDAADAADAADDESHSRRL